MPKFMGAWLKGSFQKIWVYCTVWMCQTSVVQTNNSASICRIENLYLPRKHGRQQTISSTNEIKQLYHRQKTLGSSSYMLGP